MTIDERMIKTGFGLSIDGLATWKYQIIDETITGNYVVLALNHQNLGIMFIPKDKITDIKEGS